MVDEEQQVARFLAPGGFTVEAETTLHLEQIGPDLGRHFAHVMCVGFEIQEDSPQAARFVESMSAPGMTSYAAFDGWKIVATASLFVEGDQAWLAGAATLPDERGRGAHSGLVARRIDDANALGVRWIGAATQSDSGARNLRRLGLPELPEAPNSAWGPEQTP